MTNPLIAAVKNHNAGLRKGAGVGMDQGEPPKEVSRELSDGVRKTNDNHDDHGRFASGDGSGGGGSGKGPHAAGSYVTHTETGRVGRVVESNSDRTMVEYNQSPQFGGSSTGFHEDVSNDKLQPTRK